MREMPRQTALICQLQESHLGEWDGARSQCPCKQAPLLSGLLSADSASPVPWTSHVASRGPTMFALIKVRLGPPPSTRASHMQQKVAGSLAIVRASTLLYG